MYRLICEKPADFLSAEMALVSTFFQMFLELGMYNVAYGFLACRFRLMKNELGLRHTQKSSAGSWYVLLRLLDLKL